MANYICFKDVDVRVTFPTKGVTSTVTKSVEIQNCSEDHFLDLVSKFKACCRKVKDMQVSEVSTVVIFSEHQDKDVVLIFSPDHSLRVSSYYYRVM